MYFIQVCHVERAVLQPHFQPGHQYRLPVESAGGWDSRGRAWTGYVSWTSPAPPPAPALVSPLANEVIPDTANPSSR